jgi:1-acyl-sn-glycerol-3-phosphate acyltransferase
VTYLQYRRRAPGRNPLIVMLVWDGIRSMFQLWMTIAYRLRCHNRERVPREGPVIVVSNHQSHLDPIIAGILVNDRPVTSLARATLFAFKPFAWSIALLGAVPVRRGQGDTAAFRAMLGELEAGRGTLVFPEGSRCYDGRTGAFRTGVLLLVRRGKAPVVPVAVEGAFDVWPRTRRFPKLLGHLEARAGTPVPASEFAERGEQVVLEEIRREIETMRLELRADLRRRTRGRFPPPGPADLPYWEAEDAPGR